MPSEATTVRELMQRNVRTVGRNDALSLADELMRENAIRHIPVLDADGIVCGVLSQRDLFRGALLKALGYGGRAEESTLKSMVVKEAIGSELFTIGPDVTVADAARLMMREKVGCLPVVDGKQLVGILTETDLLKVVAET